MSKTLHFTQHLLDMGRNLRKHGQSHAAARLLSRLATFRELPADLAEEARLQLAEMHLQNEQYCKARRQLSALLAVQPDNAGYHFLMACAVEDDEDCDPRRAMSHFRQCVKLDPDNTEYLCAWGRFALDAGATDDGLKALRRAGELAPDDPDVLRDVVHGLRGLGKTAEAKKLLLTALFRNRRDQRLRDLWAQYQFQVLHAAQHEAVEACEPKKRGPVLLPFTPPRPEGSPTKKRLRHDGPSATPGPKMPLRRRLSGKKH